jgi:multiple sugar transport system ATP-binding protein
MPSIDFDNVSKLFGDHAAVANLNLRIEEGEFVVLVGPSGCGKTTTLRMLAGLETPSFGRICFDRRDVTLLHPGQRDVAMVFQSYALYAHMTVYKNLSFGPEARGEPSRAIESRVKAVASLLGLEHLLARRPSELSGGQRQRVALGRAMVREPKIFLLDEPLSNLDAALRTQVRLEIAELQRRLGVTTVYVTHDQVEAMTLGHRVAVFNKGHLLQIDTPGRLYKQPIDRFVSTFIGSPRMNLVPGALEFHGPDAAIRCLGSALRLTDWQSHALRQHGPGAVELGVRPQELHWMQDAPGRCREALSGLVRAIEPTGAETFVIVDVGTEALQARFPNGTTVRIGDPVDLLFDVSDVYVFDRATGANLLQGAVALATTAADGTRLAAVRA